jgi:hypothetical protein
MELGELAAAAKSASRMIGVHPPSGLRVRRARFNASMHAIPRMEVSRPRRLSSSYSPEAGTSSAETRRLLGTTNTRPSTGSRDYCFAMG